MSDAFWRGKRVFVTGHTGFKGSWLSLWLRRLGADVYGYSLPPPTNPSLFDKAEVGTIVTTSVGDIREHARLAAEMVAFAPDVVLHLAAQSVVLTSYEDPIDTYSTNVVGTASVLNAVRGVQRRCAVVNVTTDKVYENRGWVWGYREDDALGGRDPYSSSKAGAELVARSFRASFFPPEATNPVGIACARAGNVIGGGDWTPHQLVPEAIHAFAEQRPVVLRHPGATRPWQHVLDCLQGYLVLAEALYADPHGRAGDWNFGPPDAHGEPVARVVEILAQHWGAQRAWEQDARSYPHEALSLRLNSQKANHHLGWSCRLNLHQSLEWTADWYRRYFAGTAARKLCEEQIERYMQLS